MDTAALFTAILLGLALAACCGFRVFLPVLGVCLAAHFHLIHLQPDFSWLSSAPAMVCLIAAAVTEILAYYIPWLDNLLDTLTLPLALAAGAILATSVLPVQDPMIRWALGIVGGGLSAGTVHASTGLLRLFSSKTTLGTGNHLVATSENGMALGGTLLSIFLPIVAGTIAICLVLWLLVKIVRRFYPSRRQRAH